MPIEKVDIHQFLALSETYPVLDGRSPGEFVQAHVPGAVSFPLFNDEERKVVGTAYKKQGRQEAIKIGMEFFGVKMRRMVEEAELIASNFRKESGGTAMPVHQAPTPDQLSMGTESEADDTGFEDVPEDPGQPAGINRIASNHQATPREINNEKPTVLVHCWRGGMRSEAIAWALSIYGFQVYLLEGGYKKFRAYVLDTFRMPFGFNVLGGFTGSGKTAILHELARQGGRIIDLESLANHRGSAFGTLGPQVSQEMFENQLALSLRVSQGLLPPGISTDHTFEADSRIWIEDESQRIGSVMVPNELWKQMQQSPVFFLDIPFEARLERIEAEYAGSGKAALSNSILRIQKRLGGLETKTALRLLEENNTKEAFRILLRYYDKCYAKSLSDKRNAGVPVHTLPCPTSEIKENSVELLTWFNPATAGAKT